MILFDFLIDIQDINGRPQNRFIRGVSSIFTNATYLHSELFVRNKTSKLWDCGKCKRLRILAGRRNHCWLEEWRRFNDLSMEYRVMLSQSLWASCFRRSFTLKSITKQNQQQQWKSFSAYCAQNNGSHFFLDNSGSCSDGASWRRPHSTTPIIFQLMWNSWKHMLSEEWVLLTLLFPNFLGYCVPGTNFCIWNPQFDQVHILQNGAPFVEYKTTSNTQLLCRTFQYLYFHEDGRLINLVLRQSFLRNFRTNLDLAIESKNILSWSGRCWVGNLKLHSRIAETPCTAQTIIYHTNWFYRKSVWTWITLFCCKSYQRFLHLKKWFFGSFSSLFLISHSLNKALQMVNGADKVHKGHWIPQAQLNDSYVLATPESCNFVTLPAWNRHLPCKTLFIPLNRTLFKNEITVVVL